MDIVATMKYARMSASKGRHLARLLRGLRVSDALKLVSFKDRKSAVLICKTLKTAVANAANNAKMSADDLWVKETVINEGPRMKRIWHGSKGSAIPVLKRTCHVRIVLTDGKTEAKA